MFARPEGYAKEGERNLGIKKIIMGEPKGALRDV